MSYTTRMEQRKSYTYSWPRPNVTVDAVVFRPGPEKRLEILLIRRDRAPFAGCWALPGGFVEEHEPLDAAAARELAEETGLKGVALCQLRAFGDPGRDPRGHTISIAYTGDAPPDARALGGDDAREAAWFPLDALPALAFDHLKIVEYALACRNEEPLI